MSEKNLMQKLDSPFLVKLKKTYMNEKFLYLLLEVCLGGELFNILREMNCFEEPTARFYAGWYAFFVSLKSKNFILSVVEGLAYMHSKNIIYRDLKPENLVLDSRGYLKITGISQLQFVIWFLLLYEILDEITPSSSSLSDRSSSLSSSSALQYLQ